MTSQPHPEYISEKTVTLSKRSVFQSGKSRGAYRRPRPILEQPDNPFIRYIPLTRGMYAVVDTHLYDWLMEWNWHARWTERGKLWYAGRSAIIGDHEENVVFMHKQLMGIKVGDPREGDHVDRNSLNNTGANLRHATLFENHLNTGKPSTNTSGFKGVSWCSRENRWMVWVRTAEKRVYVGRFPFDQKVEAARAYDAAALKHHGKFAVLNFPRKVAM